MPYCFSRSSIKAGENVNPCATLSRPRCVHRFFYWYWTKIMYISPIVPWFAPWNIDSIYHIMLRNHESSCAVQVCSWIYTLGTIYILVTMYRYTIYLSIRYELPYDFMHGNNCLIFISQKHSEVQNWKRIRVRKRVQMQPLRDPVSATLRT